MFVISKDPSGKTPSQILGTVVIPETVNDVPPDPILITLL